ncbi:hypothetical protein HDU98_000545 [Podochytrium sp. JEL0797]|nr:hypothetical protein HDU98_000545 [Podochytrium sp. JEL0797]
MDFATFVAAITALYAPTSPASTAAEAQQFLMNAINTYGDAWQLGLEALHHPNPQVRFFGALTLNLVLSREPGPPPLAYSGIQQALIGGMVGEPEGFVRTKMAVAAASLLFKAVPLGSWLSPVASLVALVHSLPAADDAKLRCVLLVLQVLAQELQGHSFAVAQHRVAVFDAVKKDVAIIINTIVDVLKASPDSDAVVARKLDALNCVLAWAGVDKGIPSEYVIYYP